MANGNREALDDRIALLRRQVSDLTQLASAASGTAQEENLQDRTDAENLQDRTDAKHDELNELSKTRGDTDS